ncbi:unnamed protein product [Prunus armeniaca]
MVWILMICLLDRRSVLLNSPKRGRLMSSLRVLKPDDFGDCDMLRKVVCARSSSLVERQRDADAPLRSSSCLHKSKSGCRCGRSDHPSNHHDPSIESQAVKCGVDSSSPIPLEARLAEARGGILDPKIEKPQKPTDNLTQWNRNCGKPNCICGIKNRTAFAVEVTIALVLKQHNGVLQIHSLPPTLEFVVNA